MRFDGRVAIVTGAASGIGRATAQRLASEGARLALVDRNEAGLAETAGSLPAGAECATYAIDIADEGTVEKTVADILARFGTIDVLCNNAGGRRRHGHRARPGR